jgi:Divergent InlB B-repeat domain
LKLPDVPISPPTRVRRRSAVLALMLVALAAIGVSAPSFASATVFKSGQQESWSKAWGTGEDEFFDPGMLAVDPENGNVFISDLLPEFQGTRIQEFTESGELIGETEPIASDGLGQIGAMTMDPTTGEIYLLEGEEKKDTELKKEVVATQILAFDATPTLGTKVLPPAEHPVIEVPEANQPNTVFNARELTLDPKTGDLIILGENREHQIVLQRIGTAGNGTIGAAYVDTTGALAPADALEGRLGMAVSENGTTYLLSSFAGLQTEITLHTLPPEFTSASTLTSVPGIEGAATGEKWGSYMVAVQRPQNQIWFGKGSQVAVSSGPEGDGETLYFKVEAEGTVPGSYFVRAYSLGENSTTAAFGGGGGGECGIQGFSASLAAGGDGSVVVLDQGPQRESLAEEPPTAAFSPWVMRFGPEAEEDADTGGMACPVPAAGFNVEARDKPVTEVPAGRWVTLADESELPSGQTLAGTSWTIEGPEDVTGSEATLEHKFLADGTYTVRMKIESPPAEGSPLNAVGTTYTARPQTFVVTAPSGSPEVPLTVAKTGTGTGTVTSRPQGINCGTTCTGEFEEGELVKLTAVAGSGSEFAGWSGGGCTGNGVCEVSMTAAENVTAEFTPPEFSFGVTKSGNGTGTVTCNGVECASKYQTGTKVTLTAAPDSGSTFGGWVGGGCTGTGTCTVTVEANTAITAKFALNPPSNNNGGGTPNNGGGTPNNGGGTPNNGGGTPNSGGGTANTGGGNSGAGTTHPGGHTTVETPAQKLKEKQQKAIAKCKKMKGKAKAECMKKAHQIGKPKKKAKAKKGKAAARELVLPIRWDAL